MDLVELFIFIRYYEGEVISVRKTFVFLISFLVILLILYALFFVFQKDSYTETIGILIPPNESVKSDSDYGEGFYFSDAEFIAVGHTITVLSGQDLGDSMVVLKPVAVHEGYTYKPTYITPGLEVEMDVEKGAVFRIGVMDSNNTQHPKTIDLSLSGIQIQ